MQVETKVPFANHIPELNELIGIPDQTSKEDDTQQQLTAVLLSSTSLLMGLIGSLLFHASPVGINAFLYVTLCALTTLALLVYLQRPIVRKHAVFVIPAALFALLLGVRQAPQLVLFDTAAMLGTLLIVIHFTGTTRFFGGHWIIPLQRAAETLIMGWIESLRSVVPDTIRWLGKAERETSQITTIRSVLRGIVITLPVVAVFTVLFSSADAVFGDFTARALSLFLPESVPGMINQLGLTVLFAMLFLTASWTMQRPPPVPLAGPFQQEKPPALRLNMIEASTVLGSVNFLFVTFVVIQARYFFGGEANITAQGYTYAEYARRGFYELLAVSCITTLLLVTLERLTYRKREEENLFRGLVTLLIALTFVILIAAFQRLSLYASVYGFTRIRVMSGTFMIWLAILLGLLLVAILRHRREIVWIGCMVTALGFILTLNLINLDGFIASHNITRFEETGKLDVGYLLSLSDDAVPAVATLIESGDLTSAEHEHLLGGLGIRLVKLDRERESRGVFGFHIGHTRAWLALDQHREILGPYMVEINRIR